MLDVTLYLVQIAVVWVIPLLVASAVGLAFLLKKHCTSFFLDSNILRFMLQYYWIDILFTAALV